MLYVPIAFDDEWPMDAGNLLMSTRSTLKGMMDRKPIAEAADLDRLRILVAIHARTRDVYLPSSMFLCSLVQEVSLKPSG